MERSFHGKTSNILESGAAIPNVEAYARMIPTTVTSEEEYDELLDRCSIKQASFGKKITLFSANVEGKLPYADSRLYCTQNLEYLAEDYHRLAMSLLSELDQAYNKMLWQTDKNVN